MSRSLDAKVAAWEAWACIHTTGNQDPAAFEHQCGSITPFHPEESEIPSCSGCHFEIAFPESECKPLYRSPW